MQSIAIYLKIRTIGNKGFAQQSRSVLCPLFGYWRRFASLATIPGLRFACPGYACCKKSRHCGAGNADGLPARCIDLANDCGQRYLLLT
jgi:hypothetical protein